MKQLFGRTLKFRQVTTACRSVCEADLLRLVGRLRVREGGYGKETETILSRLEGFLPECNFTDGVF